MYLLKYKEEAQPHAWCSFMNKKTMVRNDNNLCSLVGRTGSGKTWSAIAMSEIMSKMSGVPFGVDNIVFSFQELMNLINSDKLQRGSCIIFDEPQASINSRDFQSLANKLFNLLASTFRHRNFTLFFCLPSESMLDKTTRQMIKYRFITESINTNNNTCRVSPYALEWGLLNGKCYNHFLVIRHKPKGSSVHRHDKIHFWDVPRASKELLDAYEKKKREFTDRLNRIIMSKLNDFNESGKSNTEEVEKKDKRKPLTDKQEEVMRCLARSENMYVVAEELGLTQPTISQHKALAIKKGYTISEFRIDDAHKE